MTSAAVESHTDVPSGLSPEQLARAYGPRPGDIVFLSGSRLEGFGNAHSDYDVYVIQSETANASPFVTIVLDGSYVVYETFSHAQVLRTAETLNQADPDDFKTLWALSWNELELYYRVLIGRGLVNEPALHELKTRFHKPVIDACVQTWCGLRSAFQLEEAERKAAAGTLKGAYISAQQAVSMAVDAFLAARGESYPGFKWRFEKLQRSIGDAHEIYRRAWDLKSLGARDVPEYMRDVKTFCDDLGMRKFQAWSFADTPCRPAPTARLMTVRGVPYLIQAKNVAYELTRDGACVWSWIDGSITRRALIERATRDTAMSRGEADAFVVTLAQHGLIV